MIVAADCNGDISLAGEGIVGRVHGKPPSVWDPDFNPRMARVSSANICSTSIVKITADVTRGKMNGSAHGYHEVRKILADALSCREKISRGSRNFGDARSVLAAGINVSHQPCGEFEAVLLFGKDVDGTSPQLGCDLN